MSVARSARPVVLAVVISVALAISAVALIVLSRPASPGTGNAALTAATALSVGASSPGNVAQVGGLPIGITASGSSAGVKAGGPPVGIKAVRGSRLVTQTSRNWAGYVASGTKFRYVQATFTIPRLNCAKTPGTAKSPAMFADWVGLDGIAGPGVTTVEQDGISGQCIRGAASYGAWWETYPKAPVYPRIVVSPGNAVRVSVYYNAGTRQYRLTLSDLSNGEGFSTWRRCGAGSCRNASAEVITESPSVAVNSNKLYAFADCGTTSFRSIQVTDMAGQRGGFASGHWQNNMLVMADTAGHVKAATSGLSHGTAFETFWKRAS